MPFKFNEKDIHNLFEDVEVVSVDLHEDLENATIDSFAHVKLKVNDDHELENIIKKIDGKPMGNKYLRVNALPTRKINTNY